MDAKSCYAEQLQKERMRIRDDIAHALSHHGLNLAQLQIADDGYVVDAMLKASRSPKTTFNELCKRVDMLEFENYMLVDITFSIQVVSMVLVPTTEEAMNDFIWNYIMCYFPFMNEIEALSMTVGVLEHMVEPLGKDVKAQYDKVISLLIQ